MKWKKITITTTTEALDYMGAIADELGLSGFETEDNVPLTKEEEDSLFAVIPPELPPDDGTAKVHFYIDPDEDEEKVAEDIKNAILEYSGIIEVGTLDTEFSETEDKDWVDNWKEFFKPFRVDDSIVIKPTWEEYEREKEEDLIISIDPGTAFGTGTHETTKLCIQGMKEYLKHGDVLLDVGSGSGILSIIGMKLGASAAVGTDIDDNAAATSAENAVINGIESEHVPSGKDIRIGHGKIAYVTGDVIEDEALRKDVGLHAYDIVVANILAPVIIALTPVVSDFMKPGAYYVISGIINTAENDVKQALNENGFKILETMHMNDWVGFVATKG